MTKAREKKQSVSESKRRRKARKRRANVRERQRAAAFDGLPELPAPLATTWTFPKPIDIDGANIWIGLFTQIGPDNDPFWRYEMKRLEQDLKESLGVYALLTYGALVFWLGSGGRAKDELQRLRGGPGNIDYWLGIGRDHLAHRTAFESENELRQWANVKWAFLPPLRTAEDIRQLMSDEMEAVRLLFRAYQRVQIVFKALDKAIKLLDMKDNSADVDSAMALLQEAYTHPSTQLSEGETLQVAMFADVDPGMLWPQHAIPHDPTFAFGRFVGRINAGVTAVLKGKQFFLAKRIVESIDESRLPPLWMALRTLVERHFSIERLDLALHLAEQGSGAVEVARGTRELWVSWPTGERLRITEEGAPHV